MIRPRAGPYQGTIPIYHIIYQQRFGYRSMNKKIPGIIISRKCKWSARSASTRKTQENTNERTANHEFSPVLHTYMSHRAGWSIGKPSSSHGTTISGFGTLQFSKVQSLYFESLNHLGWFVRIIEHPYISTCHSWCWYHGIPPYWLTGLPINGPVHGQTCGSQGTSPTTGSKVNPQIPQQVKVSKSGATPNLSNLFVNVYFQKATFHGTSSWKLNSE